MLFYYSKKRIPKWEFWHNKGKWPFCITIGLSFAFIILAAFVALFVVAGHSLPFFRMVGAALPMGLGGTILGWMAWFENEQKYYEWLHKQKKTTHGTHENSKPE
jgi:hypothetical protein